MSEASKLPNIDVFFRFYSEELTRCMRENPGNYSWPVENVPDFIARCRADVERTSRAQCLSNEGAAFKAVCKRLGIKTTYKAVNAYLRGEYLPSYGKDAPADIALRKREPD